MAGSVNRAIILGRLGKDPEARAMQNGERVVNLSVATDETWKDAQGQKQTRVEWHRVTIWNQALGKVAEQYLKKGSQVFLEGQIQTRKWTDNGGVEKFSTEIVVPKFGGSLTLLGSPAIARAAQEPSQQPGLGTNATGRSKAPDLDDPDVPF